MHSRVWKIGHQVSGSAILGHVTTQLNSTQLKFRLLKHGSRMVKRDTVNKKKQ